MEIALAYVFASGISGSLIYKGVNKLTLGIAQKKLRDLNIVTNDITKIGNRIFKLQLGNKQYIRHYKVDQLVPTNGLPLYMTSSTQLARQTDGKKLTKDSVCDFFETNIKKITFAAKTKFVGEEKFTTNTTTLDEAENYEPFRTNPARLNHIFQSPIIQISTATYNSGNTIYITGTYANSVCKVDHLSNDPDQLKAIINNPMTIFDIRYGYEMIFAGAIVAIFLMYRIYKHKDFNIRREPDRLVISRSR